MATPRNGPPPSAADLLEQQLARLPDAFQAMQDRAIAESVRRAEDLLDTHALDRHRREVLAIVIDGGGSVPTVGGKAAIELPWSYEIEGWSLYADFVGSIVVGLYLADSYTTYPTLNAIFGALPPQLVAAQKAFGTAAAGDLVGWTTLLPKGGILHPYVVSASTVTLVTLNLFLRAV